MVPLGHAVQLGVLPHLGLIEEAVAVVLPDPSPQHLGPVQDERVPLDRVDPAVRGDDVAVMAICPGPVEEA